VIRRAPWGFEIRTVTGVAIPITLGRGVNVRTEWDESSCRIANGIPNRISSRTKSTTKNLVIAVRMVPDSGKAGGKSISGTESGSRRPDEWFVRAVVMPNKEVDRLSTSSLTPWNEPRRIATLRDQRKRAFDVIEPRRVSGRVVESGILAAAQPGAHFVMFVGGVVVDNQMNLEERSVRGESLDSSPHLLSRSCNRFFFTCWLGLLAPPSGHDSTFPTVTVCSSSGALTRILNCVA